MNRSIERGSRRVLSVLVLCVGLILWSGMAAAQGGNTGNAYSRALDLQSAFKAVYDHNKPAIVTVYAETGELGLTEKIKYGTERHQQGLGSGFIVDKRGYLVTNEHVVREGTKFSVLMSNGKKYEGRVVGKDELLDIALVRIIVPEEEGPREFPIVQLGDSDAVQPGMWTIVIGNPLGFLFDDPEPVITTGTVSGVNRTFVGTLTTRGEGELRIYGGLIQTDAVINPGNSGGPLLNIHGQVIGVNTLIWSPTQWYIGLAFAVPINTVRRKLPMLARGYGMKRPMVYGTIDARFDTLNEFYADVLSIKGQHGVLVKHVVDGGAAATAGMQDKDVIFSVNGRSVRNMEQLVSHIAHLPIGEPAAFEISRVVDGKPKRMMINVVLSGKTLKEIRGGS